jgi:uncharacterized protein YciW
LEQNKPDQAFEGSELAAIMYSIKLTYTPDQISLNDINELKEAGLDDGEILEVNQVTAYFAYANRMVLGLGINKEGDIIGLSPNDGGDMDNWSHS